MTIPAAEQQKPLTDAFLHLLSHCNSVAILTTSSKQIFDITERLESFGLSKVSLTGIEQSVGLVVVSKGSGGFHYSIIPTAHALESIGVTMPICVVDADEFLEIPDLELQAALRGSELRQQKERRASDACQYLSQLNIHALPDVALEMLLNIAKEMGYEIKGPQLIWTAISPNSQQSEVIHPSEQ